MLQSIQNAHTIQHTTITADLLVLHTPYLYVCNCA